MAFLQRTMNRGSVSTGYNIDNSLKFEADNSEYLKWTNISSYATSARKKTFSFSVWFKITETGVQRTIWANQANGYLLLQADGQLKWQQSYGGVVKTLNTNRLFRDTSAWYNVIIAVDTTQSTESNRQRLYVNGVEETSLTSTTYPSQNDEADNIYEGFHSLGAYNASSIFWSGYMANVAFISDAQITPSDVGEFDEDSGIWIPKEYSGGSAPSYFLEFKDSSDLGTATGLDADTLNNITAADQSTDTPTNNFATLNPLFMYSASAGALPIISEGATVLTTQQSGYWHNSVSTIPVTSGKWYFEAQPGTSSTHVTAIGYGDEEDVYTWGVANSHVGASSTKSFAYLGSDTAGSSYGRIFPGDSSPSTRVNYTSSNIIGVAIDADNGYVYWSKDGTFINSGDPTSGSSGTGGYAVPSGTGTNGILIPSIAAYHHTSLGKLFINFGGYTTISISSSASDANGYGTFEYAPPTGYYALCGKNLAEYG